MGTVPLGASGHVLLLVHNNIALDNGVELEVWWQDEPRIRQKNKIAQRWVKSGTPGVFHGNGRVDIGTLNISRTL